jgi:predicted Zn-dependent protease
MPLVYDFPMLWRCAWLRLLAAVFLGVAVCSCTTVPYTQRTRLMMVSESEDLTLGAAAYKEILAEQKIDRDPQINRIVRRVGERIAAVAAKPDYQWEFTVIDAPQTVNAFALPGGKVAVYTGLLPVAEDEAGLATVMGHEIAHALARHGAERMSQGMMANLATLGLAVATSGSSAGTQQAIMQAYGLGMQVGVMLPFSRSMESEADHIGLLLMADAGYDPEAAVRLWERMGALAAAGAAPPELLSTHPHSDTRIEQLRQWMPEAQQRYQAAARPPVEKLPGAE